MCFLEIISWVRIVSEKGFKGTPAYLLLQYQDTMAHKMCEHLLRFDNCRVCNSEAYCTHGIREYRCIECGGDGRCPHGKRLDKCRVCNSKAFCTHDRLKNDCKECGGGPAPDVVGMGN